ncbi:MAG: ARPP-1 family domain-containing protein [Gemmatimonadaceae bacterium]
MNGIGGLKDRLTVGQAIQRHNLTVFPLIDPTAPAVADYLPFGVAQRGGGIRITEVSASGSVPTLSVQTLGDTAVLLLDGEELIGAKQNRIVNLTILAAAKTTVSIPVSCVERGRWSSASSEFYESPQTMYPRGRAKKMMAVSASMRRSGTYGADQGEVWEDVDMRMAEMSSASPTSAMGHIFDRHRASIDEYLKDIVWLEGQVGAAFAINGKAVGVEVFESQNIAREYLPKVIRSYALDAIAQARVNAAQLVDAEEVSRLINDICAAESRNSPSLGIGSDFRIDSPDLAGAALVRDGSVIHLSAFLKRITTDKPVNGNGPARGAGAAPGARGRSPSTGRGRQPRPEGPGAETHALEIVRDHMLMHVSDGLALIDTGSPISIGRGSPLVLRGREWVPSTTNAPVLDAVREHLGVAVDWLIGYDILKANRMLLDWRAGAVHVGRPRTRHIVSRFPIEIVMGIPVITALHQGRSFRGVVDSGAALSYAPRSAVAGLPEAGEYQDFYPGVGGFTTPTWSAQIRLGEREVTARVGVLPEGLQLLFGMLLGPEGWIIGSEFFRDRAVLIDYRWRHILDLTDER